MWIAHGKSNLFELIKVYKNYINFLAFLDTDKNSAMKTDENVKCAMKMVSLLN